jgi:hypothetical protein
MTFDKSFPIENSIRMKAKTRLFDTCVSDGLLWVSGNFSLQERRKNQQKKAKRLSAYCSAIGEHVPGSADDCLQ